MEFTHEHIRNILDYDENTGIFKWKVEIPQRKIMIGTKAGCKDKARGYIKFSLGGRGSRKTFLGHRLAWFHHYGQWPEGLVDHINGIKDDNRIANLRIATVVENSRNRSVSKKCKSGLKGVSMGRNGKYMVYISLGTFDTKEEAHEVYSKAAIKLHGEFAHFSLKRVE